MQKGKSCIFFPEKFPLSCPFDAKLIAISSDLFLLFPQSKFPLTFSIFEIIMRTEESSIFENGR